MEQILVPLINTVLFTVGSLFFVMLWNTFVSLLGLKNSVMEIATINDAREQSELEYLWFSDTAIRDGMWAYMFACGLQILFTYSLAVLWWVIYINI